MSQNQKICKKCNILKSIDDYCIVRRKTKLGIHIGNKTICKACLYTEQIEYRKNNLERLQARDAAYHLTVKDKRRQQEITRLAVPENRQKRNEYIHEYKKERRNNDPSFRLYESLRKRIWKSVKNKSNSSIEYLGCDIDFYKKWIEFTMKLDMNWENYGSLWNVDHVIPIIKFDSSNNDELKEAFNWKNTCARYAAENFSKKDNINQEHITYQNELLTRFNDGNYIVIL